MAASMKDYVDPVVPYLPASLVSGTALQRIDTLARQLPALSTGGFECRLGAPRMAVDFHVGFLRNLAPSLPDDLRGHPTWQVVEAFCRDWVDPGSVLYGGVDNMILEFDVGTHEASVPVPAVFISLKAAAARDARTVVESVLERLGVPRDSGRRTCVSRCLDALPPHARIAHLGAMASRSAQLLRLNVGGVTPNLVPSYLTRIRWPGLATELDALVRNVTPYVDHIELAIDVSDTVLPRIGVECFLRKSPPDEPRWPALLDHLVTADLCSSDKRDGLLSWPGLMQRDGQPGSWPGHLGMSELFMQSHARSVFVRRLNHVKLVYEAGGPVEAKAYLSFGHYWIDRAWTQSG